MQQKHFNKFKKFKLLNIQAQCVGKTIIGACLKAT